MAPFFVGTCKTLIVYIDNVRLFIFNTQLRTFLINNMRTKDREKFVELAEKRVSRALKDIHLIGNLSNRSNYSYSEEDAKKIYSALKKALDEMKARFDSKGSDQKDIFKL